MLIRLQIVLNELEILPMNCGDLTCELVNCLFPGNKQVTAAIAFSLALFSHILNHVVIRLQNALYEVVIWAI